MSIKNKLEKLGISNFNVINKQAIREITLGSSILATGGGGEPDKVYYGIIM